MKTNLLTMKTERIPNNADFVHPLSEAVNIDGKDYVNFWGVASVLINTIVNPETAVDLQRNKEIFRHLVCIGNPILNGSKILQEVQTRNLSACLTACNAIVEGMDKKMQ